MDSINVTNARERLYELVENAVQNSEVINITSKKGDVVMISAADYKAMQETLYLLGIPGMREGLIEGHNEPGIEIDWRKALGE